MSAVAWQLQASLGGVTRPSYRTGSCSTAAAACATVPRPAESESGNTSREAAVADVAKPAPAASDASAPAASIPAADLAPTPDAAPSATPDTAPAVAPAEGLTDVGSAAVPSSASATYDPLLRSSGIEANFSSIGEELQHRLQPHLEELSDAVDSMLSLRSGGYAQPRRWAPTGAGGDVSSGEPSANPLSVASSMDEMQLTLIRCGGA